MTPDAFVDYIKSRAILTDGAMGTQLIAQGLVIGNPPGQLVEHWVLSHPERIFAVHQSYVSAGSELIHTATFSANRARLQLYELDQLDDKIIQTAVALARKAASCNILVAGTVGPTGWMGYDRSHVSYDTLLECYDRQCSLLAEAGADVISIETMYSGMEAQAAVQAAHRTGLAVLAQMTFQVADGSTVAGDGKLTTYSTFLGDTMCAFFPRLVDAGATAVGINCTANSRQMIPMVQRAAYILGAKVPIIARPNAGQPLILGSRIVYGANTDEFARDLHTMLQAGARIVGGCCGTDDTHIMAARIMMLPHQVECSPSIMHPALP